MSEQRDQFSSKIGFILAAAGSAVGIGNLVGFPVAATKNGGGAFLIIYALFVAFICVPVMLAEMGLGRRAQKSPLGSYQALSPDNKGWHIAGLLAVITPFMIAVFYMVITVWIFGYLWHSVTGNLAMLADPEYFGQFVNDYGFVGFLVAVTVIINVILVGGVRKGIEKAAKFLMPALFIMLVLLVIFVLSLDNAALGVEFYLVPDFSKIDGSVINGALAQAFFSLSLGMGILITYGSYFSRRDDIVTSGKLVALTDTAVAFTAGLMTLPAIFAINPNTNPDTLSDSSVSMIFSFFPQIFVALEGVVGYFGASLAATVFFLLTFIAAITSLVSILEVPTAAIIEKAKFSRKKTLLVMGFAVTVLTLIAATSFGFIPAFTEFTSYAGQTKSVFDVIYDVFYDTILPLNGLLICLFVTLHWRKKGLEDELSEGNPNYRNTLLAKYVRISISTFIPLILAVVFINTVLTKFVGFSLF
ncbi:MULTISPECIES: sodium-dependent transporter [Idiomarina]|jgi:NSS family neurotransmitter:Na+ symporter|uniref:Sodium-dependent transporter n=1 Tax=Idiomarina piscisalsi TaxID=1096243 RepID=A0A432YTS0_9GAMM|nr:MULTISPECIES: sodium-dependent transporter [Idiomarina]MCJ8316892.1 sodium-dependent transporter [Idiomarina sp.]NQZ16583.1 sodium-dependent transporter [Idiomarina sp.]RUO66717.1 sodium-dependent transporter [Idiomarina piscisalsi]|tara:strand:+ start:111 stop:1529 length:1419 start_codon:yes stop_codon:yes gene_type:complete